MELREVSKVNQPVLLVRQLTNYGLDQLTLSGDLQFGEHGDEVRLVELAPLAHVELVEDLSKDELFVRSIRFLQQLEPNVFHCSLYLFQGH